MKINLQFLTTEKQKNKNEASICVYICVCVSEKLLKGKFAKKVSLNVLSRKVEKIK